MSENVIIDLKQSLIELIEYLRNENIIGSVRIGDLDSQTFDSLVIFLRNMLKEKYPKTKLKRTMKSIHYANGFEDLHLKQSAFLLDEIEQYLSVNKFLNHDKSVEYFNNSITVDGFEVKPENLVLAMIQSLLCCEKLKFKEEITMIADERKQILEELVFKASVAGNDDCLDMSEEEFAEEIEQDEEGIVYKEFSKQRKIGFDNYANEIMAEIQKISSSEELHFMAENHNYDDGTFLLEHIVNNHNCAIETAQMIYWLSAPDYYYDEFGGPEYCDDGCNEAFANLLVKMNDRANGKGFVSDSGVKLSEEMDAYIKQAQLDYSKEVYAKIPECFRK